MAITFTPPAPWTAGQAVTGSNSVAYIATGTYSLKVDCPEEVMDTDTWMTVSFDPETGIYVATNTDGSVVTWSTSGCCIQTCKQDADGNKVYEIYNTAGDLVGYYNPDGTEYAGDVAALVDCKDCSPASDAQYAAANRGMCDPEKGLPVGCKSDGTLASQPPMQCHFASSSQQGYTLVGEALTALVASGVVVPPMCASIENNSCWDLMIEGYARSSVAMTLAQGTRQDAFYSVNPTILSGGGAWSGNGAHIRGEVCTSDNCDKSFQAVGIEMFDQARLIPGDTSEVCAEVIVGYSNGAASYTEDESNTMQVGNTTIKIKGTPCQGRLVI